MRQEAHVGEDLLAVRKFPGKFMGSQNCLRPAELSQQGQHVAPTVCQRREEGMVCRNVSFPKSDGVLSRR